MCPTQTQADQVSFMALNVRSEIQCEGRRRVCADPELVNWTASLVSQGRYTLRTCVHILKSLNSWKFKRADQIGHCPAKIMNHKGSPGTQIRIIVVLLVYIHKGYPGTHIRIIVTVLIYTQNGNFTISHCSEIILVSAMGEDRVTYGEIWVQQMSS